MSSDNGPNNEQNSEESAHPTNVQERISAIGRALHRLVNEYKSKNDQQHAANLTKNRWDRWTTIGVWLYTILTAVIVVVSLCQLRTARDTFNAANRPYVGMNAVEAFYFQTDDFKQQQTHATADTKAMSITMEIKNFGPVPGTEYRGDWRAFVGGEQLPIVKIPDSKGIIFPGQLLYLAGQFNGDTYTAIQSGAKVLTIKVFVEYSGPSDHYKTCQESQYAPKSGLFFNLGFNCRID